MSKKKWTNIKILGAEINAMREARKSRQEIADYFGLDKVQIKNGVHRYNKRGKTYGIRNCATPKGPSAQRRGTTSAERKERTGTASHGNKRLQDFLQFTERK